MEEGHGEVVAGRAAGVPLGGGGDVGGMFGGAGEGRRSRSPAYVAAAYAKAGSRARLMGEAGTRQNAVNTHALEGR